MSVCQFDGPPCLRHNNYVFYKCFQYTAADGWNQRLALGDFFFLKILPDMSVCIGEIELLWEDKASASSSQLLASIKLYFQPEHTPDGRQDFTGEDEVIALGDRVVLRLDDLIPLIQHDVDWTYGCLSHWPQGQRSQERNGGMPGCLHTDAEECGWAPGSGISGSGIVGRDRHGRKHSVDYDTTNMDCMHTADGTSGSANVAVLSYPKYCRYRAIRKRLEGCENQWLHLAVAIAIGGYTGRAPGCRVMFCRDTFYQSEIDDFSIGLGHMLPDMKARARNKKNRHLSHRDSQQDSDSTEETFALVTPSVPMSSRPIRSTESSDIGEKVSTEEQAFLIGLHKFMHDAKMAIGRIPSLGFKQIDLYFFYKEAEQLGGYDCITHKRMWKHLYDKLGGHCSNTSAATCTRKHYERLLLPYERHLHRLKMGRTKTKQQKQKDRKAEVKAEIAEVNLRKNVHEIEHDQLHECNQSGFLAADCGMGSDMISRDSSLSERQEGAKSVETVMPVGLEYCGRHMQEGAMSVETVMPVGLEYCGRHMQERQEGVKSVETVMPVGLEYCGRHMQEGVKSVETVMTVGLEYCGRHMQEGAKSVETVMPVGLEYCGRHMQEHSKAELEQTSQVLELPVGRLSALAARTVAPVPATDTDSGSNCQELPQRQVVKASIDLAASLPSGAVIAADNPSLPDTSVLYTGSCLPSHILQRPWGAMVQTSPPPSTSSPQMTTDETVSESAVGDTASTSLPSQTSQHLHCQDIGLKSAIRRLSLSSQSCQLSASGRDVQNTEQANTSVKPAHFSPSEHTSVKPSHFLPSEHTALRPSHFSLSEHTALRPSHFSLSEHTALRPSHFSPIEHTSVKPSHFSLSEHTALRPSHFSPIEHTSVKPSHFSPSEHTALRPSHFSLSEHTALRPSHFSPSEHTALRPSHFSPSEHTALRPSHFSPSEHTALRPSHFSPSEHTALRPSHFSPSEHTALRPSHFSPSEHTALRPSHFSPSEHTALRPSHFSPSEHTESAGKLPMPGVCSGELSANCSHSLAALLHPTPAGDRHLPHLPPAPPTVYLHPSSSSSSFLSFHSPITAASPPPAHSYPRKRSYASDSPAPTAAVFPSPDMVLDRIRNSTALPRNSAVIAHPRFTPQRFEDPRQIFAQTAQSVAATHRISQSQETVAATHRISQSQKTESHLQPELLARKLPSTKSKNSRQYHQALAASNHMASPELQTALMQQRHVEQRSSNNNKVVKTKSTAHFNGIMTSSRQTNKSGHVVTPASPVPSVSQDGRLTSALFGTQFTALPRTSKPGQLTTVHNLMSDTSQAAVAAASLNAHLHPAFISAFLPAGSTPGTSTVTSQLQTLAGSCASPAQLAASQLQTLAGSCASPAQLAASQLQTLAGSCASPAQLAAYQQMFTQNGYRAFLAAAPQGQLSKKH